MGHALVTGASSGLGALFARELAKQGRPLVLVARRADRLEALAAELEQAHGVRASAIPADLTAPGAVETLVGRLRSDGVEVETLINNAGFGLRGALTEQPKARLLEMVDLNIRALVDLTCELTPAMKRAGRGGVLNVASTAAFQPGPYMAVYYASKAFVLSFSEALHEELRKDGVHVTCLCPGATETEFGAVSSMQDTPLFRLMARPEPVVQAALRGLARNQAVVVPGLANAALAASVRLTPRGAARRIAGRLQR
jgi:hypothetical protein